MPFKPSITVTTHESLRDYSNDYSKKLNTFLYITYKTYADLKKDLKRQLVLSVDNQLSVSRSRRGEWGEWFENWYMSDDNKPTISRQGYQ